MMDSDPDGGAMNLSQRPSPANSPSDSCFDYEESEQVSNCNEQWFNSPEL